MKTIPLLSVPVRPHQAGLFCARQNNSFLTQRVALVATVLCLAFSAIPTRAQTSPAEAPQPAAEATLKLETFSVTGKDSSGYRAINSVSGTLISTPIDKLPISIQVSLFAHGRAHDEGSYLLIIS